MASLVKHKRYRVQIVGPKRQVTVPGLMMEDLRLEPGDFFEFTVASSRISKVSLLKPLPIDALPVDILELIRQADDERASDAGAHFSSPEALRRGLEAGRGGQADVKSCEFTRYRAQIIGAKRQMTIPEEMLRYLSIEAGDFLEFEISGSRIEEVRVLRLLAFQGLPSEVLDEIARANEELRTDGEKTSLKTLNELRATLERMLHKRE